MLVIIATNPAGEVLQATPCNDGIDQALDIIGNRLTHPEEDWAATLDGLSEQWNETVATYGNPYRHVVFSRRGYSSRYGLAVVE